MSRLLWCYFCYAIIEVEINMKGIEPMSSRLNLNDNVRDVFEFTIGGLDYDLKYPTLEEIDPIRLLTEKSEAVDNNDKLSDEEKLEQKTKINNEIEDIMYSMITPVNHDKAIKDVIRTQPFPVVKAFNKMLNEQFTAE